MGYKQIIRGEVEPIKVFAVSSSGSPLTGKTDLYVRVQRSSDNYFLDWNDDTFKASGHTTLNALLTEIDASNAPGLYELSGGFDSGAVTNLATSDSLNVIALQTPGTDARMPSPEELLVMAPVFEDAGVWADLENGSDSNEGYDANHAVKTWQRIRAVLDANPQITRVILCGQQVVTFANTIVNYDFPGIEFIGNRGGGEQVRAMYGNQVSAKSLDQAKLIGVGWNNIFTGFAYFVECDIYGSGMANATVTYYAHRCHFSTTGNRIGNGTIIDSCLFRDGATINLNGLTSTAYIFDCTGELNLASAGSGTLEVYGNSGMHLIISGTVTTGTINVYGDCDLTDNSGAGATVNDYRTLTKLYAQIETDHGAGSWENTLSAVGLIRDILKAQMTPWAKHIDSVANALSFMRDIEGGKQLMTATGGGQLETFADDNATSVADFETYDKNDARTSDVAKVARRDRIANATTGDTISWTAATALSDSVAYISDENDLVFEGRLSNGAIPILKPYGTADTSEAGEEYWIAPTAASGFVQFRLLHTGTQAAHAGLSMSVLSGATAPALVEFGTYTFDAVDGSDADAFIYNGPAANDVLTLRDEAPNGQWAWSENSPPSSSSAGPTSGAGGAPLDGYIYTESSSPASADDIFWFELEHPTLAGVPYSFPAPLYNIVVDFKTCQRGTECNATLDVETNEGAGWVSRFQCGGPSDPNKVPDDGAQIWAARQVDLTGIVSAVCRIRVKVTMPSSGNIYRNDYGVDEVKFTLTKI